MSSRFWIAGASLLTQNSRRELKRANLLIEDGRIAEITPKKPGKGIKVHDATGRTLLPGFVQAHVHLCQTLFRNQADDLELLDWLSKKIWPMEAAHTEETLHTSALLGIHELLSSGTTCILDMATVRHTEAVIDAVLKTGIRASVGKCLMDHPKTTPANLREPTRDALAEAVQLFKRWNGHASDRLRISLAPRFVVSCTEKLLLEVASLSREEGALIHTHASENLGEIQLVKKLTQRENVEYLHGLELTGPNLVLAHCIWLKPHEMKILERTGTHVAHCPSSNMKLASGFARVPEMLARGINVALGADGAPCNNNLDQFREMRLAALIHKPGAGPKAMRAQEVLDMATRNGAKALGWWDDIGSIEVGKKADLIALDLTRPENLPAAETADAVASAIVYSTGREHLRTTWVDGRKLFENGRVAGLPAEALLQRVAQARQTLRTRAKFRPKKST
jgi:cytosine/adenosine deaminase-related metal-dependent hydrolase